MSQVAIEPFVLKEQTDGIVTITLNRPLQFNALSQDMLSALQSALDQIAKDDSARVVVLAGAGKAFCAGHNLKEMRAHPSKDWQRALFDQCSRMMMTLTQMPQPVIARVHGIATAAGCQLVAMCDLAVASDNATFATSGINYGLFCSTPGVGVSRNMGRKQAFEMLFTGSFISAEEARARGLINRVVPLEHLDAELAKLTEAIVSKSRIAVETGKKLFYQQLEGNLTTAYDLAAEAMACNMLAEDALEGIDAFIEKRKPVFKGR
jgi:enoyl-CoA hydratase/carnithine racemase